MQNNIVTLTDSYKFTHWKQYPDNTDSVYSYFEARTGAKYSETVFFGLQYLLKEYLEGVVVTGGNIRRGADLAKAHFGNPDIFNLKGWEYILNEHKGRLPVKIRAVPEGTPVPVGNVLMTVENLDPRCFWLTNHLETLLTHVWHASTVATLSWKTKLMLRRWLEQTADQEAMAACLPFMLHDFGFRGVECVEAAGIGGAGHLVNFLGTDTVKAIEVAMEYYGSDVCAYSVPATEHSVMTSYGPEGEVKVFEKLLDEYPTGILSVVSDSYDIFNAAMNIIGGELKERILERDGVFVVRPDSGEPVSTVLKLLDILWACFEGEVNEKGYKALNPKIKLIWGDGIDYDGIYDILRAMESAQWSAENIVFGMGGGLLQKINRDTQRFAFKCCAQKRDGEWYDIYKEPLDKTKTSKKGRLALVRSEDDSLRTEREGHLGDILETVFENGDIVKEYTFDDVRANAVI